MKKLGFLCLIMMFCFSCVSGVSLNRMAAKVFIHSVKLKIRFNASGFAVDRNHVLTAGHFCQEVINLAPTSYEKEKFGVFYINAKEEIKLSEGFEIVKVDNANDLCLIRKDNHGLIPVKFSKEPKYKMGDKITVVGSPLGIFPVETTGKIIDTDVGGEIVVSARTTIGNSGSPLFDRYGNVIGMTSKILSVYDQITLCIKLEDIREFLKGI